MPHFMPQAVQLATSACKLASQPSAPFMLQSPQPGSHVPEAHLPATQAAEACTARQCMSQAPQFFTSVAVSTHLLPQHFCAFAQRVSSVQPTTHDAIASEM